MDGQNATRFARIESGHRNHVFYMGETVGFSVKGKNLDGYEATWGGGATELVGKAGGQTGPHQIMLREVEIYGK